MKKNVQIFEECNEALAAIREWSFKEIEDIRAATATLNQHMQGGAI
ncbi:MAG TPA: hypothetical protein VFK74_08760 [Azospira sp.]|nr:hypothetical protein [Azospira sp.]